MIHSRFKLSVTKVIRVSELLNRKQQTKALKRPDNGLSTSVAGANKYTDDDNS